MVSTKALKLYLFFIVIFYFFGGLFGVISDNDDVSNNINLRSVELYKKLNSFEELTITQQLLKYVLVPLMPIEIVTSLLILIGHGFATLPTALLTLIFIPLGFIVLFEYVLPYIRGN